jgi:hypothetical protein
MGTVADMLAQMAQPASSPAPGSNPMPPVTLGDAPAASGSNPFDKIDPPKPPHANTGGVGANFAAGLGEGLADLGGQVLDAATPIGGVRKMLGTAAALASGSADVGREGAILNPAAISAHAMGADKVTTTTGAEKAARAAGQGVSAALPEEGGLTVLGMLRNMATGVSASEAGNAAAEAVPDQLKPIASTAAALAAGGAAHLAAGAAPGAIRAAAGVADTPLAAVSPGAAERGAARVLASRATDPEAAAAALEQPGELVPGSQPTTFQQTGDPGLGSLEREVATANQPAFQERAAQQNAARVGALSSIQQGADPNEVAATLRAQFDDLDTQTQAHIDQLTQAAQNRAAAMGGDGVPEEQGSQIRSIVNDAEAAARQRERGLWRAVDPNGDLTGNVMQTAQAAKDIAEAIPSTAKPMSGEEAAIFRTAQELPPLAPVSDLIALRSRVSTEMRNELIANGTSPTYARLTQLRGAIQDNLATTISQQIANEQPAIARGALDPSQSTLARLQSEADAWRTQRTAAVAGSDGTSAAANPEGGAAAVPGVGGAAGASGAAPGGPADHPALPGTPSFDETASQRLKAATAATKERASTFGQKPLSQVTAKAGSSELYRLPDGQVPKKFFHPGATGYSDMRALFDAVGEDKALPAIVDYAATSLRRAAMRDDGTLDPAKYERWRAAYTDALRALPDAEKAKFTDAASASQALADARASRTAALKDAQAGAIGRVMKLTEPDDVTRTVGAILNSKTAVADMKQLALATKGDPDARAGLRQAVADYMAKRLIGNTEVGTSGVTAIKADAFQTFMKQAKPALNLIFSPEEVRTMEAVAEDIQRAQRSINSKPAGTPGSAHDVLAGLKKGAAHGGKSMLDIVGVMLGEHHGGTIGAIVGGVGMHLIQALHGAGVARIDALVAQAMLNPQLARELLKKAPAKPTDSAFRGITRALAASSVVSRRPDEPRR